MAAFTARVLAGKSGLFSGVYSQQFQFCQKSFGSLSYMSQQKLQAPKPVGGSAPLLQNTIINNNIVDVAALQKRNIFMGFDPVGTTGLLYALSVGSVLFLPALVTAQTGPDRVDPASGYDEEPKEKSKELIFGRLPKNHAHGSFLFMVNRVSERTFSPSIDSILLLAKRPQPSQIPLLPIHNYSSRI